MCGALTSSGALAASTRSRRMRSIARCRAVVTSQARGWARDAVARPALGGDREGLLRGFLGGVQVAEEAGEVGDDATPLGAEDRVDRWRSGLGQAPVP